MPSRGLLISFSQPALQPCITLTPILQVGKLTQGGGDLVGSGEQLNVTALLLNCRTMRFPSTD